MSLAHIRPGESRKPIFLRLPDSRWRMTRFLDLGIGGQLTDAKTLAWGSLDPGVATGATVGFAGLRLIGQSTEQAPDGRFTRVLVYEQIPETAEQQVGNPEIAFDQYGRKTAVYSYQQFSAGTPVYQVVGTTAAPAPHAACILKTEERTPDDGCRRFIKRTYIDPGRMADDEELRFGGKVKIRTLTGLNQIPTTPTGFTLATQSVEFIEGLPVYRYGFSSAAATAGAGGVISQDIDYSQSDDQGTTGVTLWVIRQVSELSVSSNPIATPSGSTLIGVTYADESGYRVWTARYAKGTGLVAEMIGTRTDGLREVTNISLGTRIAPSGIVVRDDYRKADGYDIFTVTAMQTAAGGADPTAATMVTEDYVPFTYPGRLKRFSETYNSRIMMDVFKSPLVTTDVLATISISYQTSEAIGALAETKWQPTEAATMRAQWIGLGGEPRNLVEPYPGYRSTDDTALEETASAFAPNDLSIFNQVVYGATTARIIVTGGPVNPDGNTYTLDARTEPAFISSTGTKYWRRIVVEATIPTQAALPV